MRLWTFCLILSTHILTACGQTNIHQFHQNFCYQEINRIGMLQLEIDAATDVLRENNETWQKMYDDKICLCQIQDLSYDVQ